MNMNTKYALIANAVRTRIPFCADGRTDVRAPMFLLMFVFIFFLTHSLTLSFRMGLLIRLLDSNRNRTINDCHHVPLDLDSVLNSYNMKKDMLQLFSSSPEHRMRKKANTHTHKHNCVSWKHKHRHTILYWIYLKRRIIINDFFKKIDKQKKERGTRKRSEKISAF